MTLASWQFTAIEFHLLWEAIGRESLPYPFQVSMAAIDGQDFQNQRREVAVRLNDSIDRQLFRALEIFAEPEWRVEVLGVNGTGPVRVHAGVDSNIGVVAEQLPGRDDESGTDIVLRVCHAQDVPNAIAGVLPQAPAGVRRGFAVHKADLRNEFNTTSVRRSAGAVSSKEQLGQFFRRPRSSFGEITVFPGSAIDSRPTGDGVGFFWYDFVNDGRYVVGTGETISARPVAVGELADEISRCAHSLHSHRR